MESNQEGTAVVIIGAGVSGLALATLLGKSGVPCVVLERRDRANVEMRQRAGVVEARAVQMFERWGLADKLLAGPVAQTIDYRLHGSSRIFNVLGESGQQGRFCTQQMLVNNLLRELIDDNRGDVRFEVSNVTIQNDENDRPHVRYSVAGNTPVIRCDHIVGCDADRGVTRASIPEGVLTQFTYEFGYAWLAALVEAPVLSHPIMGVSNHGFVAQLPRGPQKSRYYLQCALADKVADWPDERIWDEIRLRLADNTIQNAVIHDKDIVPLRSVVHSPMQYRNLFLVGDAAHLLPPTGAKGMNLALYEVDVLAQALRSAVCDKDHTKLANYSDEVLPQVWKYQEFSAWMTETMHDAGNVTASGKFRRMIASTRLDALFSSPTANRLHSEYLQGTA